jgi:hypothetical protein
MGADRLHTSLKVPFEHNRCDSSQLHFKGFQSSTVRFYHHAAEWALEIKGIEKEMIRHELGK